jgi:hypothetical protein
MSVALAKAIKTEKRLNQAILDGNNLAGWTDEANAINAKFADQAKQTKVLSHGLSVIDASMDSPVDVEIQGRTLVSLGSSVLEATKNYVLADKKTKLKWADATTVTGVAKFVGKNEKPSIIRVSNFEGKVLGSTLENPHNAKLARTPSLLAPSSTSFEESSNITRLSLLDGSSWSIPTVVNGNIAQTLFSFDIIAAIERNIGRIPKATLAEKVQWCKDNVKSFKISWHGFGSSVGGNKATLRTWYNAAINAWSGSGWQGNGTHSNGTVTVLSLSITTELPNVIDTNGMYHALAHAEASDSVVTSTINTDYIDLEIELKPEAVLHDPITPLYEVDATEYGNILTTWAEAEVLNRFPKVQGVQHLQNPYVMAEGENLLPPFSEWTLHANAKIIAPYELELVATASGQLSTSPLVPTVPNQPYTLSGTKTGKFMLSFHDANGVSIGSPTYTTNEFQTITSPSNASFAKVWHSNDAAGTFTFTNPILTLGTVAKPFTPRNPSYLFAQAKLGQIGTVKDSLFKQDGLWNVRKVVEKDVLLDGSLAWTTDGDLPGQKVARLPVFANQSMTPTNTLITKYDGLKVNYNNGTWSLNTFNVVSGQNIIVIAAPDTDTGFGETYIPLADEFKAYFNGWQGYANDPSGKPTAWRSLGDGTVAPTQTLAYVSANKAPNYTPYKLSYVLATPKIDSVNVEGDISVNGLTQVEVGSGVIIREKVIPTLVGQTYRIGQINQGQLKYKNEKIIGIFKNGITDMSKWEFIFDIFAYGKHRAFINQTLFDATAEYTVTYLLMATDRHLFTNNAIEIKAMFDSSLKSVVDTLTERQADLNTITSVNIQAIAELYKRVKALGG